MALSAGVQRMVRSDLGASGVMFTLDTESGFRDVVFITSSYGLGEMVVQGAVNPDEFYVHKPQLAAGFPAVIRRSSRFQTATHGVQRRSFRRTFHAHRGGAAAERASFSLSDAEVLELARHAMAIEKHYGCPMDIEWGKDGLDGKLYILQARPETVKSNAAAAARKNTICNSAATCWSKAAPSARRSAAGRCASSRSTAEMDKVQAGDVLVTDMTDPNWEPVMKKASAIVTNRGGRTCHAAIIARELGIPAIVGCGHATTCLQEGEIGHRFLRRRRHRFCVSRQAAVRSRRAERRRIAAHSGQADAQRGQPHAGVRVRATAIRRGRSGTSRIHHQQPDRHPSQGRAGAQQLPGQIARSSVASFCGLC